MQVRKIGTTKWDLPTCQNFPTVEFNYDDWKAGELFKEVEMTDYEFTNEEGKKLILPFFGKQASPYVAALEMDTNPMIIFRGYFNTIHADAAPVNRNIVKRELLKFLVPRHENTSYILFYRTPEDYEGILEPTEFMSSVILNYPMLANYGSDPIATLVTMNTDLENVTLYTIIPERFMGTRAQAIEHCSHYVFTDENNVEIGIEFTGMKFLVFLTANELKEFDAKCKEFDKEHE